MSEKLGNHSEEVTENSASVLEEEAGQFDPQKAEAERQKVINEQESTKDRVLSTGEVSKLSEDENGKAKLESEYMSAWRRYEESENYDKKDYELGKAIWQLGMGAALLDVNKDVIDEMQNGEGDLFEAMQKDIDVLHVFDKACEDMEKIANSGNKAAAKEAIDFVKNTGKVGEFIVEEYEDWLEIKTMFKSESGKKKEEDKKKPDEKEYLDRLDTLENRFSRLNSKGYYDSEEIEELAASYKELQRKIYDPKTREKIEDRYNSLINLRDRLESIQSTANRL